MRNCGIKLIFVQIILFGSLNTYLNANTVGDLTSSSDTIKYLFSNDTLRQSITIIHLKDQIQYIYNVKNINRGLTLDLKGFATKVESENMQFGEFRDSVYLVDAYQDKKGDCWMIITLDNEKEELLTIDETTQCKEHKNHLIPVNSLDILQREKRKKQ